MRLLFIILFFLGTNFSFGQNYAWEIGGGLGTSNYFGDIGGLELNGQKGPADIMLETTRFNLGGFTRRMLDYRFYLNFQLNYIYIIGDDKLSPNTGRTRRNLNFENHMFEGSGMIEYHPLIINDLGGKRRFVADLHLYVAAGLGIVYSEPLGTGNLKLRPLATEGPSNSYSPIQAVVPFGGGMFVSFKGRYSGYRVHRVGISMYYHLTFTDYLDDVSSTYPELSSFGGDQTAIDASYQGIPSNPDNPNTYPEGAIRGDPTNNDGYLTTMIYYSKRIRTGRKRHKLPRRQEFYGKPKRSRRK